MLMPRHEIVSARSRGMTSRRAAIISGVAVLHVAIVYAIVTGMANHALQYVPPELKVHFTDTPETKTPPAPPKPVLQQPVAQPQPDTMPPPVIDVATDNPLSITVTQAPPTTTNPPPDASAAGVTDTHTVPPYPAEARVAAHQGTVTLRLVVSAVGDVTSAAVVQSSGFPELDQAAVSWVQSHWKYKPAMQNGTAVPSQTAAAVKFDLKQASR